jgi:hypothetical protein
MEDLRVPKRRIPVQLSLSGGATRDVWVFLTEFAATHSGAERLSDVLNGEGEFIPVIDAETQKVFFLNRTTVAVARVAHDVEGGGEDAEQHTIPTEHEVEITVSSGMKLRGLIAYVLPLDRSRLTDFLNDTPPFIKLLEGDKTALINKHHVSLVEAL